MNAPVVSWSQHEIKMDPIYFFKTHFWSYRAVLFSACYSKQMSVGLYNKFPWLKSQRPCKLELTAIIITNKSFRKHIVLKICLNSPQRSVLEVTSSTILDGFTRTNLSHYWSRNYCFMLTSITCTSLLLIVWWVLAVVSHNYLIEGFRLSLFFVITVKVFVPFLLCSFICRKKAFPFILNIM